MGLGLVRGEWFKVAHRCMSVTESIAVCNDLVIFCSPTSYLLISPTGEVTELPNSVAFLHNVDSFEGNSGAPVFASATGVVEGIHVSAPFIGHFQNSSDGSGSCVTERLCSTSGCFGQPSTSGAIRITLLSDQIPLTPALIVAVL